MACHYHPDRESTDTCAICGKSICKECGLEIAGKVYCKECLEKIVGIGIQETAPTTPEQPAGSIETEPAAVIEEADNIYEPPKEYDIDEYLQEEIYSQEPETVSKAIRDDSPYNIKENINYDGGLESSYLHETENSYQPQQVTQRPLNATPNEIDYAPEEITQQVEQQPQDYIYPDHSYTPEPTSARQELEDKYEKYLDDLYFDENEVPLGEQLAKDEEQYGSLTRRPYTPRQEPPAEITPQQAPQRPPKYETPEEMEARIRAEIAREMSGKDGGKIDENIHNLNYQDEKEPMGIIDILLTIILIIVILIVLYYLIYLFILSSSYPTFMDALFGLTNPQNVINNVLSH